MAFNEILQTIGFSKPEITVYTTLLEHEPQLISNLARQTGMHRPAIYQHIERLMAQGLVTTIKKGKQRLYAAESPEKITNVIQELQEDLNEIMPELQARYERKENKPIVKSLEGRDGIRFVLNDLVGSLKKHETFYRYSSGRDAIKSSTYLPKNYRRIRDEKQLQRFVIANEGSMTGKKPRMDRAVKFIPKNYGLFDHDITQIIYGDKIALIDYQSETATIIENAAIAEFQKKIFKLLYDKLPTSSWT